MAGTCGEVESALRRLRSRAGRCLLTDSRKEIQVSLSAAKHYSPPQLILGLRRTRQTRPRGLPELPITARTASASALNLNCHDLLRAPSERFEDGGGADRQRDAPQLHHVTVDGLAEWIAWWDAQEESA
jgi:hypothetical protein